MLLIALSTIIPATIVTPKTPSQLREIFRGIVLSLLRVVVISEIFGILGIWQLSE
jgi:hypothetical protein